VGSSVILPAPGQPTKGPDPAFQSGSLANVTTFNWKQVAPPVSIYVQRDDVLVIQAISSLANETINVQYRQLLAPFQASGQPDKAVPQTDVLVALASNTIEPGGRTFPLVGTYASNIFSIPLTEGYLLSVAITAGIAQFRGQTYARAFLMRSGLAGANEYAGLCGDYCTLFGCAAWPNGRWIHPSESTGFIHSVQVANPGAGVDWILAAQAGSRRRIVSANADLAVANSGVARPVEIIVDDGANVLARMATNTTAPINATAHVNFSNNGTPPVSIASDLYAQAPAGLVLGPTMRVRSNTTNIVAGDAWTNIWFLIEDYIDGL
jgi:hypothetical protein